jgi:SAM-dependent methyltransferase
MSVSGRDCPIPCNLCAGVDIDELADRDRDGRPLRTTICRKCGLVWSNPRPCEDDMRRYYSREYRLDYKGQATPSLRHVARSGRGALDRYRALSPFVTAGDRTLDVGAGGGEVVYVFRKLGLDARGLEPDEQYARHAREALGVPVDTGFVQDASFPPASFEAVTMYHALEHVEDPVGVLRALRAWLKDGGVLAVEVPNVEARSTLPAHRFHFAHLYNFNRATLEATGRRAGFDPVQTTTSPDEGNLVTVFRASPAPAVDTIGLDGNYARVARAVGGHTAVNYYLSRAPYTGPLRRLRHYLADRKATRGAGTPTEVLDALLERART